MSNNIIPLTDPCYNEGHVQTLDSTFAVTTISGNHTSGMVLLPTQGLVALAGSNGTGGLAVQLPAVVSGLPGDVVPGNDGQKLVVLDVVGEKHLVYGPGTSGSVVFTFSGTAGQKNEFLAFSGQYLQPYTLNG